MGRKREDLRGRKFGKLTAIEMVDVPNTHHTFWRWRCDCGNEKVIRTDYVKSGSVKSCGCIRGRKAIVNIGDKFGKLTVLEVAGKSKKGELIYKCKCDCGNITTVKGIHLFNGNTKSCGCIKKERMKRLQSKATNTGRFEGTKICKISHTEKLSRNNTSGTTGVCYSKRNKCWVAYINFRNKRINLGGYKQKEDAIKARKAAEEKYFKPVIEKYNKK